MLVLISVAGGWMCAWSPISGELVEEFPAPPDSDGLRYLVAEGRPSR